RPPRPRTARDADRQRRDGRGLELARGLARRDAAEGTASLDLVRHRPARRAEVAQRRIRPEVRDARRVEVRVVVDLLAEPRVLVALAQTRTPVRIERAVDARLERVDLGIHQARAIAQRVDRRPRDLALVLETDPQRGRARRVVEQALDLLEPQRLEID